MASISEVTHVLKKGRKRVLRNGRTICFWTDKWVGNEPLCNSLLMDIDPGEKQKKAYDYWIKGEGRNWEALNGLLSTSGKNELAGYMISEGEDIEDSSCWGNTNSGRFSINSAYELITDTNEQTSDTSWKDIWKLEVPYKIRAFIWTVKHEKIMSNVERVKRGFTANGQCAGCQNQEDVDHIFRKCEETRKVWNSLMPINDNQKTLNMSFDRWLWVNLRKVHQKNLAMEWNKVFAVTFCGIWHWRNKLVFDDKKVNADIKVKWIQNQIRDIKIAFVPEKVMPINRAEYTNCLIRWKPPPPGWKSINVDGSYKYEARKAGGGGILRDERGDWIMGFMHNIGWCDVEEAELWAAFKGLELAWNSGFKKIVFGINSEIVVKWLHKEEMSCSSLLNLISICRNLLERDWEVMVEHVYREQNMTADYLATEALKYNRRYRLIYIPPVRLHDIIEEDKMGIWSCRRIISS